MRVSGWRIPQSHVRKMGEHENARQVRGAKGGKARAEALSPAKRKATAKKARSVQSVNATTFASLSAGVS